MTGRKNFAYLVHSILFFKRSGILGKHHATLIMVTVWSFTGICGLALYKSIICRTMAAQEVFSPPYDDTAGLLKTARSGKYKFMTYHEGRELFCYIAETKNNCLLHDYPAFLRRHHVTEYPDLASMAKNQATIPGSISFNIDSLHVWHYASLHDQLRMVHVSDFNHLRISVPVSRHFPALSHMVEECSVKIFTYGLVQPVFSDYFLKRYKAEPTETKQLVTMRMIDMPVRLYVIAIAVTGGCCLMEIIMTLKNHRRKRWTLSVSAHNATDVL